MTLTIADRFGWESSPYCSAFNEAQYQATQRSLEASFNDARPKRRTLCFF